MHGIYRVVDLKVIAPFTLRLKFDDGVEQTIDFAQVLYGEVFGPLRNQELFDQVRIDPEVHTIVWPNGADFEPATLHDWPNLVEELTSQAQHREPVTA